MCTNTTAVARSIIVIARSKFTFLISPQLWRGFRSPKYRKQIDKSDNRKLWAFQESFSTEIHFIVVQINTLENKFLLLSGNIIIIIKKNLTVKTDNVT